MKKQRSGARRVLILVENLSVPFDRRVWRESQALVEKGYHVSVVCPRGRDFDTQRHENCDGVSIYRYTAYEASGGMLGYAFEFLQALFWMSLLSIIVWLREGFDVIQICNPPDLLFFVTLPYKLLGKKVIFDHHDLSPETYQSKFTEGASGKVHRILMMLERWTFRWADVVMSTNESYRELAITRGAFDPARVFVVRNGPNPERVHPVNPNPAWRRDKRYLLVYLGTMGAQDGVDYALRAIQHLIQEQGRTDFQTVIVGGGGEWDNLRGYAQELGLGKAVTFTGRVPDKQVMEILSSADVCLSPDPLTPLNNVSTMNKTLEYMAMSKPVVAFELRETQVSAGDAALYATPNDEAEFAAKISLLLDSEVLRTELGEIGRKRIVEQLSWNHSKEHLYAAYDCAYKLRGQ